MIWQDSLTQPPQPTDTVNIWRECEKLSKALEEGRQERRQGVRVLCDIASGLRGGARAVTAAGGVCGECVDASAVVHLEVAVSPNAISSMSSSSSRGSIDSPSRSLTVKPV